jgi:hypothetical protein
MASLFMTGGFIIFSGLKNYKIKEENRNNELEIIAGLE